MEITVAQLAKRIGAELIGDGCGFVTSVRPVKVCSKNDVTFLSSEKFLAAVEKSKAGAVILNKPVDNYTGPQLVVKNVDAALIKALNIFAPELKPLAEGIDPAASVGQNVEIAKGASIGAYVAIDDGVQIGKNTIISPGCKIGENSKIGDNCRFDSNVVIYHNCTIGNNVIIQANTTIGSTGFGYSLIDGSHRLIPHNGAVIIEDFVEIGANCCIDRAKFENTVIGAGTKIDNFVQIAHNVVIGKCCLIAGQVGIAGSCRIGNGVVLAGRAGSADNIEIGDNAIVGARSVALSSIPAGKRVLGMPAIAHKKEVRLWALRSRLPEMAKKLKQLSARMESLEAAKDDKN